MADTRSRRLLRRWWAPFVLPFALSVAVGSGPAGDAVSIPSFRHVVVVVFENHERGQIVGTSAAPTFAALAREYATLTRYYAVAHPSLPNYLALVSGSTQGIVSDCISCRVAAPSLADQLASAGRSWKTYAEGLPAPGYTGASAGRYAKKHDPFLYFGSVLSRPTWRQRVVPFRQLASDLRAGRLPDFALVVPDLCNDMHDCPVSVGDRWLRANIVPAITSPALAGGVIFIVFDEGITDAGGGGHVEALAAGPVVRPRSRFSLPTDHYGLLRTIEQAWHLPLLANARHATPITGIWR